MTKPLIGLSISIAKGKKIKPELDNPAIIAEKRDYLYLKDLYTKHILKAGGLPILLPIYKDDALIGRLDGILIPGGDDINPKFYKQDEKIKNNYEEDIKVDFDLWLIEKAIQNNIPLLGICYGLQVMNIYHGGTLFQDLSLCDYSMQHGSYSEPIMHDVNINKNSYLYKIYNNDKISAFSMHHQAICNIGDNLTASAVTNDGIIEAIEYNNQFNIGLQWHPEEQNNQDILWNSFIDKCINK